MPDRGNVVTYAYGAFHEPQVESTIHVDRIRLEFLEIYETGPRKAGIYPSKVVATEDPGDEFGWNDPHR